MKSFVTDVKGLSVTEESARFMAGVYRWMTMGILLTAVISAYIGGREDLVHALLQNKLIFYGLIGLQFVAVIYLSACIAKISATQATFIYLLYAALTGVTLSVIFMAYTQQSIQSAFFTTAISFAGLSFYGQVTKRDLGPLGTFCHMGVWGLVGISVLSFFFPSMMGSGLTKVFNFAGVLIFAGLTAYDTQKIKKMNIIGNEGTDEDKKETIMGALTLYLDFINLFLFILRFMGRRK